MKKRTLALLLSAVMLFGLLTACGSSSDSTSDGTEESEETETETTEDASGTAEDADVSAGGISYPVGSGETYTISVLLDGNNLSTVPDEDPGQTNGMLLMQEATGINLDYTVYAMLSDGMTLMIASGEWTDIFAKINESYNTGLEGALDDEVILDLAPYIEEYAPDYYAYLTSDSTLEKQCYTDDGQMGAFMNFSLASTAGYAIRMDWLEEAGITEVPETFDELEEACLAVLNNHPELESVFPLAASLVAEGYETEFMIGYGIDSINNEFYIQEDGTVGYAWTSDSAREYLTMLARWVDEGILNRDEMISGDLSDYGNRLYYGESLFKHGGTDLWGDEMLAMSDDEDFELAPMNYPTVEAGDTIRFGYEASASPGWSISTTCENPELLMQAINWLYTEEGMLALNFGEEDISYIINDEGEYEFTELITNNPDGIAQYLAIAIYTGFETPTIVMQEQADAKLTNDYQYAAQEYWATQDRTTDGVYHGNLTTEESEELAAFSDIDTYVQEKVLAFAVGELELTDENWESFISTVESMGIADIIQIYQDAQDRYNSR